jgi:hypothetical protein
MKTYLPLFLVVLVGSLWGAYRIFRITPKKAALKVLNRVREATDGEETTFDGLPAVQWTLTLRPADVRVQSTRLILYVNTEPEHGQVYALDSGLDLIILAPFALYQLERWGWPSNAGEIKSTTIDEVAARIAKLVGKVLVQSRDHPNAHSLMSALS